MDEDIKKLLLYLRLRGTGAISQQGKDCDFKNVFNLKLLKEGKIKSGL